MPDLDVLLKKILDDNPMGLKTRPDEDNDLRLVLVRAQSESELMTPLVFSGVPVDLPENSEALGTICRMLLAVEIDLMGDEADLDPRLLKFRQEAKAFFGPSLYHELICTISVYTLTLGAALVEAGLRSHLSHTDPSQFN